MHMRIDHACVRSQQLADRNGAFFFFSLLELNVHGARKKILLLFYLKNLLIKIHKKLFDFQGTGFIWVVLLSGVSNNGHRVQHCMCANLMVPSAQKKSSFGGFIKIVHNNKLAWPIQSTQNAFLRQT